MSENEHPSKNKKVVLNVVYSVLVFFASSSIGLAVLDSSAINGSGDKPQVSAGGFLAVGIGIVLTIIFSMWFAKRKSR